VTTRYAIYFTPPDHTALARFGEAWFAPARQRLVEQDGDPPRGVAGPALRRHLDVTAEPAVYGLHATLKPPFALAPGRTPTQVLRTARRLAARCPPIRLPRLRLDELDGFLALRPVSPCPRATDLAAACVRAFDPLRARPSPDELIRRRACGLGGRQDALLCRWGYPFVLDQWRFHMTLTRRLEPGERAEIAAELARTTHHATRNAPLLDAITVCEQPDPHQPFRVATRFPLGAPSFVDRRGLRRRLASVPVGGIN